MPSALSDIVEAVRQRAVESPDSIALEGATSAVSYRQLVAQAEGLAAEIREAVAGHGFVGIAGDRQPSSVIAMVASLMARTPFVVLHPADSDGTNQEKCRLLGVLHRLVPAGEGDAAVLEPIPSVWSGTQTAGVPGHLAGLELSGLAYAITTSGSTGHPKCVLVNRAPLFQVVSGYAAALELDSSSRTLQFARLTFDGCITEVFSPLVTGGTLVIPSKADLTPGSVLSDTLVSRGITHLKTTPYALRTTSPDSAFVLRHVVNGGGPCRPAIVAKWEEHAKFHNAYGLTETTVCNLITEPLASVDCQTSVPLGTVIAPAQVGVRSEDGRVDFGSDDLYGELVVSGPVVAHGYLTDEGLTALAGQYHTGDMVRREEGQLYFVQRNDRQLKVRGFRVDPGEVEMAVCGVPGVRDAVVVASAYDDSTDEHDAIACYYEGDVSPRDLRASLSAKIDPYKIPSIMEHLSALPYSINGKVDRKALEDRRSTIHEPSRNAMALAPDGRSDDLEVLGYISTLTGNESVSLDDNFFEVGGDSASAVLLVSKMRKTSWPTVGIRDLLRAATIGDLLASNRQGAPA